MEDKSDEETVWEEAKVEQTSAASLAWVLDTCAEAVVELTDAEDFADACIAAGPAHHGRLMTGASEVMEAVQEAYYQNHLENHERWATGYMERTGWLIPPPLYPEEWEHWCYEIPHTIS